MLLLFKICFTVTVLFQVYSYINYSEAFNDRDWKLHGLSIFLLMSCLAYAWQF